MGEDTTRYGGRPLPGRLREFVLDGDPAPSHETGHSSRPSFRPMSIVAKWSPISATAELLLFNKGQRLVVFQQVAPLYVTQFKLKSIDKTCSQYGQSNAAGSLDFVNGIFNRVVGFIATTSRISFNLSLTRAYSFQNLSKLFLKVSAASCTHLITRSKEVVSLNCMCERIFADVVFRVPTHP